jgi:hypothetical protein
MVCIKKPMDCVPWGSFFERKELKQTHPPQWDGLICFLFVGDVMKLKDVLKSPWTAFHGSFVFH